MARHALAAAAGFLAVLLVASVASAQRAQQDLEAAEQAYGALEFETAFKGADRVAKQRGLTHEQLVRAYKVLAQAASVLEQRGVARDAYVALLAYDPDYKGDPALGPKVQEPFLEALGYWRSQVSRPGVEVTTILRPGEPGTLRVTTRDPTHLARRATVGFRWGSTGTFTTTGDVAIGDTTSVDVPPAPSGVSRLDYYAQVFDERDDAIFEVGNPSVPKTSILDLSQLPPVAPRQSGGAHGEDAMGRGGGEGGKSIFASPYFWIGAAVVVAGGVTGAYLLTHKSEAAPTQATFGPTFFCGAQRC